jgi:protein O-GlcNAc transferase
MTDARSWLQRGLAAHQAGETQAAVDAYRRAIELADDADAWHMLGMLRHQQGDSEAALDSLQQALRQRPADPAVLANRAAVHLARGDFNSAEDDAELAARSRPQSYAAWINLGLAQEAQGMLDTALSAFERAHALRPGAAAREALLRCLFALAKIRGLNGRPSAAEKLWLRYLALGGDSADAWLLRANVASDLGRHEDALDWLAEARRRAPGSSEYASAELIARCHCVDTDVRVLSRMTRAWAKRFCTQTAGWHEPATSSALRRIGFYSPRFAAGPMASLVLPLLQQLHRQGIEVFLYAGFDHSDDATPRFRAAAQVWRDVHTDTDEMLVQRVSADALDALVDLCGHAPGNRLRALAQRMAPLQVSWGDWFASTGVPNMDAFLGDAVLTPAAEDDCYSERVLRLAHSRFVYAPQVTAADVPVRSRRSDGRLRFVSLNRISKLTDATVSCWARVLNAVPESELMLRSAALDEAQTAKVLRQRFAHHGIAGERILCAGFASYQDVLADYAQADIALDPFPFNGCVTTLDALWMGVPVVALRGRSLVARQGASLLTAHGCEDWVAASVDEYVGIAVRLAQSLTGLEDHRRSLLAKRDTSALFDVAGFTADWLSALSASLGET